MAYEPRGEHGDRGGGGQGQDGSYMKVRGRSESIPHSPDLIITYTSAVLFVFTSCLVEPTRSYL